MKLSSVREFKQMVADEVRADMPSAQAFFESTEAPLPPSIALGIGLGKTESDFVVEIRASNPLTAAHLAARAKGEANVRLLTIAKRNTPAYLQGTVRPLEAGAQIQMVDKPFVGTLGGIVRDRATGALCALTNSHVAADEGRVAPGWQIGQPFGLQLKDRIGTLLRYVPFSDSAPNLVDAALVRLARVDALQRWNGALAGDLARVANPGPEDLGRTVLKLGRTTGARLGRITAVEMDGVPVAYDRGVLRFNDQLEISGGPATDFSAPGDSGSWVIAQDGTLLGLLFAGGRDSTGEDFTYANPMATVFESLGVQLP